MNDNHRYLRAHSLQFALLERHVYMLQNMMYSLGNVLFDGDSQFSLSYVYAII